MLPLKSENFLLNKREFYDALLRYRWTSKYLANLLKEVCHDVQVEPHLQTLTEEVLNGGANSSDEARLDVSVRSFLAKGATCILRYKGI